MDRKRARAISRKVLDANLLTSGKLNSYLADIDQQAEEMFERLIKQMVATEGITEQLKAADSMEWVRKMNNIRNAVKEIVSYDLILLLGATSERQNRVNVSGGQGMNGFSDTDETM